jgi:hypothetical protein
MSAAQHISVKPLSGISPEQARDARARAWIFVFDSWNAKNGGSASGTNSTTFRAREELSDVERRPD